MSELALMLGLRDTWDAVGVLAGVVFIVLSLCTRKD